MSETETITGRVIYVSGWGRKYHPDYPRLHDYMLYVDTRPGLAFIRGSIVDDPRSLDGKWVQVAIGPRNTEGCGRGTYWTHEISAPVVCEPVPTRDYE